jgi:hypothetical protein
MARTIRVITGNQTPPGAVVSLTADQFIGGASLIWVLPINRDVEFVEVLRSQSNNRDKSSVVGKSYATTFQDITASGTYFYWVRCVNTSGVKGDFFPASASAGLEVNTYLGSSLGTSFPVGDFGDFSTIRDVFNPNIATGPQFDCMVLDGATLNIDLGDLHPDVALGDFGTLTYDPEADVLALYDWGGFGTSIDFTRECGRLTAEDVPVALGDFGTLAYNPKTSVLDLYNWGGFAAATLTRDLGEI